MALSSFLLRMMTISVVAILALASATTDSSEKLRPCCNPCADLGATVALSNPTAHLRNLNPLRYYNCDLTCCFSSSSKLAAHQKPLEKSYPLKSSSPKHGPIVKSPPPPAPAAPPLPWRLFFPDPDMSWNATGPVTINIRFNITNVVDNVIGIVNDYFRPSSENKTITPDGVVSPAPAPAPATSTLPNQEDTDVATPPSAGNAHSTRAHRVCLPLALVVTFCVLFIVVVLSLVVVVYFIVF